MQAADGQLSPAQADFCWDCEVGISSLELCCKVGGARVEMGCVVAQRQLLQPCQLLPDGPELLRADVARICQAKALQGH